MGMKIFITQDDYLVKKMFLERGHTIAKNILEDFDVMVFTGGSDVNPIYYGERPIPGTQFSPRRDALDNKYWRCQELAFPKVGICRGSQFGNVMCGGSLWQDVDGHAIRGDHLAKDEKSGRYIPVSSTHHQMSRLAAHGKLLASAKQSVKYDAESDSKRFGRSSPNDWEDVEAFYYASHNFLGVQFHPEYPGFKACQEYFWELFDEHIGVQDVQVREAA
jgi:gamma-glutamyl-gamma-aminobutyrate hydrolase PuuD